MELFLPGLIVLLLTAFFTFLVLPRLGTTILLAASVIALLLAGWHHYYMFSSEYRLSTWQDALVGYAPWVVLLVALMFVFNFFFANFGTSYNNSPSIMDNLTTSVSNSSTSMPPASTATNPITAGINNAIKSMNSSKSNSPLLANLGFSSSQV